MIGYAICGSFCTHKSSLAVLKALVGQGMDIQPIMSQCAYTTDTRFGSARELRQRVEELCQRGIIHTIEGAEPLGPKLPLDALIIAPCTGNTLSKLASGITDTPVTMAAKATMRNKKPVIIAPSTNDGLSGSAKNIGTLLNTTQQQYYKYEKGIQELPTRHLKTLAKFYNTSADYILGLTNDSKPYKRV
jgi:dipicolinate synthase subunit B